MDCGEVQTDTFNCIIFAAISPIDGEALEARPNRTTPRHTYKIDDPHRTHTKSFLDSYSNGVSFIVPCNRRCIANFNCRSSSVIDICEMVLRSNRLVNPSHIAIREVVPVPVKNPVTKECRSVVRWRELISGHMLRQ